MKKKKGLKQNLIAGSTAVLLIGGIVGYTKYKISDEVDEVPVIYTKSEIAPRTEITKNMLVVRSVPSKALPPNAVTDMKKVVGKWTVSGYGLSKNSLVYKDKISKKENLPDSAILNLKEDEVAFSLLVDLETSLGNSIVPNSKVDLYFRTKKDAATQEGMNVLYGKLASQIRVVAVKDAQAANVFETEGVQQEEKDDSLTSTNKQNTMASIYIFAVPQEVNVLLNKAKLVGDVVPVATSEVYKYKKSDEKLDESMVVKYINGEYADNVEEEDDTIDVKEESRENPVVEAKG
ncbi:RcpC/CpaB family pilus assembly protein [Exiguobacterium antarcticum]|uniref:RcpC/CpaB family pilus assembly protein n=1 Tax=Exiguobacterium antarcticum TaxID=132920 RepID=A0ABT6R632_9BACL|nr:RcpC/CpaB family pilus assembly protein [Exiguobacterium antarcticum]MDI3236423.1 RcpC/CpaB family pilus assembly protein [Exiguobacterium antarcticum]